MYLFDSVSQSITPSACDVAGRLDSARGCIVLNFTLKLVRWKLLLNGDRGTKGRSFRV